MKYILFDTETTGIADDDRIIQVGAMILDSDESEPVSSKPLSVFDLNNECGIEKYDELCSTTKPISLEAMETHHITPEMIENKPEFKQTKFYKRLNELNNDKNYLIAHNIKFDLSMLEREGFLCKLKIVDTYKCAIAIYKDVTSHRLQHLRYALGLYKFEKQEANKNNITIKAHDAIGDVLVMKLLFDDMLKHKSIEELHQISLLPVLLEKFSFGKYKGSLIKDICESDSGYIDWCLKTFVDNEDLIYSIRHYRRQMYNRDDMNYDFLEEELMRNGFVQVDDECGFTSDETIIEDISERQRKSEALTSLLEEAKKLTDKKDKQQN